MTVILTRQDAEFIRLFGKMTSASPESLAREYGVSPGTVRNIQAGHTHTGKPRNPRKDRKLSVSDVREIRRLGAQGMKEDAIKRRLSHPVARSTIRQVLLRISYKDIL